MSDGILGERYFAVRRRLTDLLHGIIDLASESGARMPDALADVDSGLGRPFRVMACGEINAGKSTLLNSLCGHPVCAAGALPVTGRIQRYRHHHEARQKTIDRNTVEILRPLDFLRDFELIDTPGLNDGVTGHLARIDQLAADVDLLLCVFPVSNPWMAGTWDFIGRLAAAVLDRTVLVIQQADLRDPGDISVILGHVADLSRKRVGRELPVFAVAAGAALDAKLASPRDLTALRHSGLPQLETFISENICLSRDRRALLEDWRARAAAALRAIDDHIEDQHRETNEHARFLAGIESEVGEIREEFVARLPGHLSDVAAVFESEADGITRLLRRRLWALPSLLRLFKVDRTGQQIEDVFIERLRDTIEAVAAKDGDEVVDACLQHWASLTARVSETMGCDLMSAAPVDEILGDARQCFVKRLGVAAGQGVGDLKVRNRLDKDLRRRNRSLRSFTIATLVLTTAGAVCGALGVPWLPLVLCAIAALFFVGGLVVAWITRRSITRDFRVRLLDTCEAFAATLHSDYVNAMGEVFRAYITAQDPLHQQLVCEKLAIEPRLRRWQELFLTLKAIEQDW